MTKLNAADLLKKTKADFEKDRHEADVGAKALGYLEHLAYVLTKAGWGGNVTALGNMTVADFVLMAARNQVIITSSISQVPDQLDWLTVHVAA